MSANQRIKQAWQSDADEAAVPPSLDEARRRAGLFHRRIRQRNAVEYAAGLLVLLIFSGYAWLLPSPSARLGAVLIILGTFSMMWQLRRRGSSLAPPSAEAGLQPILLHQRDQLVRQEKALSSIVTWYLLPFLPGLLIMMLAPILDHGRAALVSLGWRQWSAMAVAPAVFAAIWWLNRRAAGQMSKQIEAIDALLDEGH
jgi:hypothetical protein